MFVSRVDVYSPCEADEAVAGFVGFARLLVFDIVVVAGWVLAVLIAWLFQWRLLNYIIF